jgi:hypothetical protein
MRRCVHAHGLHAHGRQQWGGGEQPHFILTPAPVLCPQIVVQGIPWAYTWRELKDLFNGGLGHPLPAESLGTAGPAAWAARGMQLHGALSRGVCRDAHGYTIGSQVG